MGFTNIQEYAARVREQTHSPQTVHDRLRRLDAAHGHNSKGNPLKGHQDKRFVAVMEPDLVTVE